MEPPSFPLPNSQQRAGSSRQPDNVTSPQPTFTLQEPEDDNPSDLDDEEAPLPPVIIEPTSLGPPPSTVNLNASRGISSTSSKKKASRTKVYVQPGYSQLDWARLQRSGEDLRGGVTSLMRITPAMLAQHKSKDDCWQAYGGKVYDVTRFLPYHPGGVPQMMRAAGKDGTELFMKTHAWVNVDMMLEKCLIGFLVSG
ncbi:hypothetical protein OIO90_005719 [Microbotryomycetes sp. JL221]|nr:hypothetical protein OIO90_005719 [Microbotryomycetes sp. JL221]